MTPSFRTLIAGLASVTMIAGSAQGFPDLGASCADCHGRADGAVDFDPSDLLAIAAGNTGQITFDVTDIAAEVNAAISLTGLDVAGLMATPDLTGWNNQSDGTDTWLTSDLFNMTGPVDLQLSIDPAATPGEYSIDLTLAGGGQGPDGGRWSTMRTFDVRVIPEPMTVTLLGIALLSGGFMVGRRFFRPKVRRYDSGHFKGPD